MARPAKSIKSKTGTITKAEEKARTKVETRLRGTDDKLHPPDYLTEEQKRIFLYILENLDESKMLGNLDQFILASASVTIAQLQDYDMQSNKDPDKMLNSAFRMARSETKKNFFRCCNELCLSPQSRAKLSISAVKAEPEKKTIMDILNDESD